MQLGMGLGLRQPETPFSWPALLARYGNPEAFIFDNADPARTIGGLNLQFEEYTGITAVDAAADPVGLYLDRSQGVVLGSELVANGNPIGSGWTSGAGWSVSGGEVIASNTSSYFYRSIGTMATGDVFEVVIRCSEYTSGSVQPYVSGGVTLGESVTAVGTYTARLTASSAVSECGLKGTGFTGKVNLISARKVSGNHAYQGTALSRPSLQLDGSNYYHSFDGSADHWQTGLVPASEMTIAACFRAAGEHDYAVGALNAAATQRCYLGLEAGGLARFDFGSTGNADAVDHRGADIVLLGRGNASNRQLHINGGTPIVSTGGTFTVPSLALFLAARNNEGTPSSYLGGRLYTAFAMQAYASDADALLIQRALAQDIVAL